MSCTVPLPTTYGLWWGIGRGGLGVLAGVLAAVLLAVPSGCKQRPTPAAGPPQRIVTLTPSSTELVCAVGGLPRLVGVDRYSTYPEAVTALPRVGDFLTPDLERIFRLRPDLVVLDDVQTSAAESLEAAGIPILVLSMHSLADVRAGLDKVGAALGTEDAARAAIAELDRALAEVEARARARPGPAPRTLAVVDRQRGELGFVVAAGPGSFLDELLTRAGGINVLADRAARYPKLSPEDVLVTQPDIILDSADAPGDWAGLKVPAVQGGRIRPLSPLFNAPGPRAGDAARELSRLLAR